MGPVKLLSQIDNDKELAKFIEYLYNLKLDCILKSLKNRIHQFLAWIDIALNIE